jgi:hypothetical protein
VTSLPGLVLRRPLLLFDAAYPTRSGRDAQKALSMFGPYDNSQVELGPKSVLFVYPKVLTETARELGRAVFAGAGPYQGFQKTFRVPVVMREVIQPLEVDAPLGDHAAAAAAYRTAIDRWRTTTDAGSARLAIVLTPDSGRWETDHPYYAAKAALAALGVPSQMATAEMVSDAGRFKWAAADIALASFAKLGGVPWTVEAPAEEDDLVLGIGRREVGQEGSRRRVFGYAVAFVSNGAYRHIWTVSPTADEDEYARRLQDAVDGALSRDPDTPPKRLVVHLASRTGRTEIQAVQAAMTRLGITLPVAFLRLDDSSLWNVADDESDGHAAPKGSVVRLGPRRVLLQSDELTAAGAPEGPILVEMDRRSTVEPETLGGLVAQAYRLSHANWRGFRARSKPATLVYGEQLADLVGHMAQAESWTPDALPLALAERPWFL